VIPKAVASFAKTSYAYTGKVLTPAVTVKTTAGKALEKDKAYTVTYSSGRKDFGEYYATVKLSGTQYSGTAKISFNIVPGKATVTVQENTDSIKLSWSKVKGATGYRVYAYNTDTKKYTTLKTLTGTSYVVTGLNSGTDYVYTVRAYAKANGKNVWGSHSFVYTATVPATVKISSATLSDAGKVTLKWGKTAATGYEVYMSTGTGQYKKIKTTTKNSTITFTTSALAKGKNYSFIIRAYKTVNDGKLYGDYSKVKSVSVK
jgi:fibronectin type 3 domain-containing protein